MPNPPFNLNIMHIMPKPRIVPIFWGHDYVANPLTTRNLRRMISDLVTGPFLNGLAQYGVQRGSMSEPIIVDDVNPPATLIYTDSNGVLVDDITKQLLKWINVDKIVPGPSSDSDINQLYVIIPPRETHIEIYNNATDPTGNGVQGFHSEENTNPASPTLYWTIVKTDDALDPSYGGDLSKAEALDGALDFVGASRGVPNGGRYGLARKVCHELVEQCADRNGTFIELGDKCVDNGASYREWAVQQYSSVWDGGCINGESPVSLRAFLRATSFAGQASGLRALGASTLNVEFIAASMRIQPAPDTSAIN